MGTKTVDVRQIASNDRARVIAEAFEALAPGESFELLSDGPPLPMLGLLVERDEFSYEILEATAMPVRTRILNQEGIYTKWEVVLRVLAPEAVPLVRWAVSRLWRRPGTGNLEATATPVGARTVDHGRGRWSNVKANVDLRQYLPDQDLTLYGRAGKDLFGQQLAFVERNLKELNRGESLILIAADNPRDFFDWLPEDHPWRYLEKGPETWRVQVAWESGLFGGGLLERELYLGFFVLLFFGVGYGFGLLPGPGLLGVVFLTGAWFGFDKPGSWLITCLVGVPPWLLALVALAPMPGSDSSLRLPDAFGLFVLVGLAGLTVCALLGGWVGSRLCRRPGRGHM